MNERTRRMRHSFSSLKLIFPPPAATNVSSVAVDAVVNQSSLLDVSWKTQDDLSNCSSNFSVTWARLDDLTLDEAFTADLEYTIADLDAFTRYNVCVATCLGDVLKHPVCGVNTTEEDGKCWSHAVYEEIS